MSSAKVFDLCRWGYNLQLLALLAAVANCEETLAAQGFYGSDAHVAGTDQSLRGLRPPNPPKGFADGL